MGAKRVPNKNTNIYKITRITNKSQNMNYGIYSYNKTNICLFYYAFDFPFTFCFQKTNAFWHLWSILYNQLLIFNIGFGLCVFVCIWEHTLKICFDILRPQKSKLFDPPNQKQKHFQKC